MKKFLFILLAIPLFSAKCTKNNPSDNCLKARVVRITCASFVVQVLNNDSIGEDNWRDSHSSNPQTYDNVFAVANTCKVPPSYKTGDVIYFNIESPKQNDCIVCAMWDAPPKVLYDIKNISATPCRDVE